MEVNIKAQEEVRISPRTGKPVNPLCNPDRNGKVTARKRANLKARAENYKKSPVIGNQGLMADKGDNTKYMSLNMELYALALQDIDMHDPQAVANRLEDYYNVYIKYDVKPTVAGMALVLNGMSRRTLIAIVNGYGTGGDKYFSALPTTVALVIKRAYSMLEILWETYSLNGKINPVAAIFLGKNNFGYQDKTETVVTPNVKTDADYSVEEIKQRYLTDSSK